MNPAFYIRKQHTFSLCMNKTDGIKTNKIADIDTGNRRECRPYDHIFIRTSKI